MAYLTSSSTYDEVVAAYKNNASYDLQGNATMAKEFIDACRQLLILIKTVQQHGGARMEFDPSVITQELATARGWLSANDSTATTVRRGGVRYADFRNFRS